MEEVDLLKELETEESAPSRESGRKIGHLIQMMMSLVIGGWKGSYGLRTRVEKWLCECRSWWIGVWEGIWEKEDNAQTI